MLPAAPETKQNRFASEAGQQHTHNALRTQGKENIFFAPAKCVINEEWLRVVPVPGSLATVGGFVGELLRGCTVAPCTPSSVMNVVLPWSSPP